MEFGFWVMLIVAYMARCQVLILVIMEFGFWVEMTYFDVTITASLNPCYNGIWFLRTLQKVSNFNIKLVLILVIMEFGFWELLILTQVVLMMGLNPCYNGIWFLSSGICLLALQPLVLILVIMEFGFWVTVIYYLFQWM